MRALKAGLCLLVPGAAPAAAPGYASHIVGNPADVVTTTRGCSD